MLEVKPLHPLFVGEASGIDLRAPLADAVVGDIVAALDQYGVLIFPGQPLDDAEQVAFSGRLGPLEVSRQTLRADHKLRIDKHLSDISNLDENNRVLTGDDRRRMGGLANRLWHTDSSFKRVPARYSLLSARSVPPSGGETEFADMRAAWDALPPTIQARIDGLVAEHSIYHSRATIGFTDFTAEERAGLPPVPQVIVRTHPGSKRKSLYLASHAGRIEGMPVPEGRMLLLDLMEHATQRQFVYTHRWRVGDLVIWDDRCTMHRARDYDMSQVRDMRRTTVSDGLSTVEQALVA